jgi:hypothetical protein
MTEYLTGPRRLAPSFDADPHLARLDEDGFTIVEDYMSADQLASFREGLTPYLDTYRGRNPLGDAAHAAQQFILRLFASGSPGRMKHLLRV